MYTAGGVMGVARPSRLVPSALDPLAGGVRPAGLAPSRPPLGPNGRRVGQASVRRRSGGTPGALAQASHPVPARRSVRTIVMRTSAIVVGAVVGVGLVVGWLLDRRGRGSPFADRLRFMSHFLLRAYVAAILGWSPVLWARHHDALHLGLATLLGLLMLWSIFMAGVFAWGAWQLPSSDPE